ncbi:hypothetical protein TherJR_1457 [Thermincola potens JR]|uniref:Uncharacterized protein n=1 Tax=Thermincola potens (strain JR) TaxID=635013 RepID=D5XF92_THEPJ|nr:hypothetical protein TherJR_1457 [Thermincola potens JR]
MLSRLLSYGSRIFPDNYVWAETSHIAQQQAKRLRYAPTQLCLSSAVTVFAITWQKSRRQGGRGKATETTPRRSFGTAGQAAHWEKAAACLANGPFLLNKAIKPTQMSGSAEWPNDGVLHDRFGVTIFADQVQKPRQPCGRQSSFSQYALGEMTV